MSELVATATPKARKAHRCWACGATIYPGERYRREARVGDGSAYTLKLCLPCDDATPQVLAWSYCYDIGPETYAEWAEEAAVHTAEVEQQQALDYLRRRDAALAAHRPQSVPPTCPRGRRSIRPETTKTPRPAGEG